MKINEKIRKIRKEKRFTSQYIANKIGLTRSGYAYFENGFTDRIYLDNAIKLADALEVPFFQLFEIKLPEIGSNEIKLLQDDIKDLKKRIQELNEAIDFYKEINEFLRKQQKTANVINNAAEYLESVDFEKLEAKKPICRTFKKIQMYRQKDIKTLLTNQRIRDTEGLYDLLAPFMSTVPPGHQYPNK